MRKKLIDILEEGRLPSKKRAISYLKTNEDPNTNSIEWKVQYDSEPKNYEFKDSYTELDNFIKHLTYLNGRTKPVDPHLEELLMFFKNLRNRYKRYLNNYQPGWDEK